VFDGVSLIFYVISNLYIKHVAIIVTVLSGMMLVTQIEEKRFLFRIF
jgi:hypothetical protein